MIRPPDHPAPRTWLPRLSPRIVRWCQRMRRRRLERQHRVGEVQVLGLEHLRQAVAAGKGVMITPNHPSYSDPEVLLAAADRLGIPFYYLTAWEMFADAGTVDRWLMQRHGCFSIDRDRNDLRAFRNAVDVLATEVHPMVVFAEGHVYQRSERPVPFRDGAAAIARAAARRAARPIACVPCAIRYEYVDDPTPELRQLMASIERHLGQEPQPDLSLVARIHRVAERLLTGEERRHLGRAGSGPLRDRAAALLEHLLRDVEARLGAPTGDAPIPERAHGLRQRALAFLAESEKDSSARRTAREVLDQIHVVTQLYSYPPGYLAERPSLERIAESLARLEEDVFGVPIARPRGIRRVIVSFGAPLPVEARGGRRQRASDLTATLQREVQVLLAGPDPASAAGSAGGSRLAI